MAHYFIQGGIVFSMIDDKKTGIIKDCVIEVKNGKIIGVGQDIKIPSNSTVIDASSSVVVPGFVDAHSHIGLAYESFAFEQKDINETTNPVTPELRVIDAIWPNDSAFEKAIAAGVTTVCVCPGSSNVIGGTVAVIKTYGRTVEEMLVRHPAGLKVAFGINPKVSYGNQKRTPMTRMAIAALFRKTFVDALEYLKEKERAENCKKESNKECPKPPKRDLAKETIVSLLKREFPMRAHSARVDDLMTAIRIAEEFGIDLILDHAYEANYIADEIARRNIPVILGPYMRVRGSSESQEITFKTAKIMTDAGALVAMMTDHPFTPEWYLPLQAALAVREGMDPYDALKTITINAAKILGVDNRVGSLESGKDADIAIFNKHPFNYDAITEYTIINGKIVYQNISKS